MKTPSFWYANQSSIIETLLFPFAKIWGLETKRRLKKKGYKSSLPVICVGNVTIGGAGKTPTCINLGKYYQSKGFRPAFLSRGYGAKITSPIKVDASKHHYNEVGDEPLLLSQYAPTWVCPNRADGAKAIEESGEADIIIMDDGMQNPSLHKDYNILIIDGGFGLGNKKVIPAGPLREALSDNQRRVDIAMVIGDDIYHVAEDLEVSVVQGEIKAQREMINKNEHYWAFCGLGRPSKFYETLRLEDIDVKATFDFDDHHPYSEKDITDLIQAAQLNECLLITTEKDKMRIPAHLRDEICYLPIRVCVNFATFEGLPLIEDDI